MDFLIVNGEIVSKNEANLTGFLWDEPHIITQKMWFGFGGIPLFAENIAHIGRQLDTLNVPLPALFKNTREIFRLTKRMLNKNKFYRSGLISFRFFISLDKTDWIATSLAFPEFDFPFSMHGLLVNFSGYRKNSKLALNGFKAYNLDLWTAARAQIRDTQYHGSIIVNEKDRVCEGIAANIFMVRNDVLLTPSPDSGCYQDVLRPVVQALGKDLKLKIAESSKIQKADLFEMNEVFFASEEFGIQWVLGIENKRYVHRYSPQIHEKLNVYLKGKV